MAKGKGPAMRKLAQLVARRVQIRVDADYSTEGRSTKWHLTWDNGPTADVMRRHVRAVATSVPGLDVAEVGYRRDYSDRHVVAAWLRRAERDDRVDGGRWAAEGYFQETGFPADIAGDDPLWELVDYAFALCGGPDAYAERVIEHVAKIGLRGLRLEQWLDQPDDLDSDSVRRRVAPLLDASGLSERTRRNLHAVAADIVRDLAGNGPRHADPRVRVLVAEAARAALTQPVDDEQRRQALECVADGTPLYKLSSRIGKSESTLVKRWNPADFNRDLAPLAWLQQHEERWAQACTDAVAEVRANRELAEGRDIWLLLSSLERAAQDSGAGWQRLMETPQTARKLLVAVPETFSRIRQDRLTYRTLGGEPEDGELAAGPALHRLADMLAQYDTAPPPRRRGGAHPGRSPRSAASD
ncbi:hypothetical protein [Actinokineospora enzanensis]|uniref:hypothetical protein n=1 Tax=Actinokineospora enzanensis TaxID=155975 RepID=UPI00039F92FB|nr:hypothetical protein [Actinokineospora enzanensis]